MKKCRQYYQWIKVAMAILFLLNGLVLISSDFSDKIMQDTQWLSSYDSRIPGNPSHKKVSAELEKKIRAIPNTKVWVQEFSLINPICTKSEMTIESGKHKGTYPVYPVWPDVIRTKKTPKEGINGKLILCKNAEFEDLPAKSLKGQIAVIEMSRLRNWKRPFELGAKAMLLLGSPDDEAVLQEEFPFYRPRYYVPEGKIADAIRRGEVSEVNLKCDASWVDTKGRNILALVKGTEPPEEADPIVIVAPYDSMSLIMNMAPGADNAVDAAFLLNILRHFAELPPKRSVLFAFIDATAINHLGMRHFLLMLSTDENNSTRNVYMKIEQERLDEYENLIESYKDISDEEVINKLYDKRQFKELQRYCKDVISPEVIHLNEKAGDTRLALHEAVNAEDKKEIKKRLDKIDARLKHLNKTIFRMLTANQITDDIKDQALAIWRKVKKRTKVQLEIQKQRVEFFSHYDKIRDEIAKAIDYKDTATNPFRFLLAIDISDSSTTIGPALRCEIWNTNEKTQSLSFTRWLKLRLEKREELFKGLKKENLIKLGILPENVDDLLKKILNLEAIEASQLAKSLLEEFPDIDEAKAVDLAEKLKAETDLDKKRIKELLKEQLPKLNRSQMDRLSEKILNQEAIEGDQIPESFAAEPMALLSASCSSFGIKGVTWATLEGARKRVDTPQDTFERLDWKRILPQIRVTSLMLEILLNNTSYKEELLSVAGYAKWRIPHGSIVTETISETIPRTPNPDMFVTMISNNRWRNVNRVFGIRGIEFTKSEADGSFRFAPFPASIGWAVSRKKFQAYTLDENGEICRGISDSTSMISGRVATSVSMRNEPPLNPGRLIAFDCRPFDGPLMFDSRYQAPLYNYSIFDVIRGGKPKRYSFQICRGQIFGLMEPNSRWQLIMRSGLRKNRMIFMNIDPALNTGKITPRQALMRGYGLDDPFPEIPELMAVRDFYKIDEYRLKKLAEAGVKFPLLEDLHEQTKTLIEKTDQAYEKDDGKGLYSYAKTALTNELRVYHAILEQSDDVVRGAIFLLILLVPFAVAMERLLFAAVKIGNQIFLSIFLFVVMAVILWSFHPGFRISSQPLVILMAFIILVLSTAVIVMVLRKFKSGLEEIQRGEKAEASGAQTSRGGVISSALWLGIANMRKRLLRTILTGLTIVIITFALLCFTSSSTYQDKRIFSLEELPKPEYSGALVQHPALRHMSNEMEDNLRNLMGDKYPIVGRYWLTRYNPSWRLHLRNPENNEMVALKGALGLSPQESKFSDPGKILEHWDDFGKGETCYISETVAKTLKAKKGDEVLIGGMPFKILSIYNSKALEKNLRKIDGQSMLPLDFTSQAVDWSLNQENIEQEMADTEMIAPDPGLNFLSGDDIIIIPNEYIKKLDPFLNNIAVKVPQKEIKPVADKLMKALVYPIYYNDSGKIKVIVATPLIPKAPRKLFIPLMIAVLIIFNTMLNSVAERKQEIHVYTSLGLAPVHVGMLFMAEAATYGLMGSVFGYIVGQGLATILTHFKVMGGIVLNYSGTNVILTMGLVLTVVLLSALVPAIMASKVANPSKEGDWKVPHPIDGIIKDLLPFTVTIHAAKGLICFIYEYMDAHTDGAIGEFTSDNLKYHEKEGDSIAGLAGTVWLAPYDLGVRQDFKIEVVNEIEDICNIRITLKQQAGQERSWWRLNKVFLSDLRRQFLGWRNIKPERALAYIEQGTSEFKEMEVKS